MPWAVSLRTLLGTHFCTGSIISQWWVATAGHCVFGRTASAIGMAIGRVTLDGLTGQTRQGFRIQVHPEYNAESMAFE